MLTVKQRSISEGTMPDLQTEHRKVGIFLLWTFKRSNSELSKNSAKSKLEEAHRWPDAAALINLDPGAASWQMHVERIACRPKSRSTMEVICVLLAVLCVSFATPAQGWNCSLTLQGTLDALVERQLSKLQLSKLQLSKLLWLAILRLLKRVTPP